MALEGFLYNSGCPGSAALFELVVSAATDTDNEELAEELTPLLLKAYFAAVAYDDGIVVKLVETERAAHALYIKAYLGRVLQRTPTAEDIESDQDTMLPRPLIEAIRVCGELPRALVILCAKVEGDSTRSLQRYIQRMNAEQAQ